MSRRLTRSDAMAETRRLERAGFRSPEPGAAAAAELWVEVLYDVAPDDLREAVTRYIRGDNTYWPTPGQLLRHVREARAETATPTRTTAPDPTAPCPVCNATLRELQPEEWGGKFPRLGVLHDVAAHQRAGVGWIGLPDIPTAQEPQQRVAGGALRHLRIDRT